MDYRLCWQLCGYLCHLTSDFVYYQVNDNWDHKYQTCHERPINCLVVKKDEIECRQKSYCQNQGYVFVSL